MITINFASTNYRLIARITAGLIAAGVVLALVGMGLIWNGLSLRSSATAMGNKLAEARAADEKMKPILEERQKLVKDLNAMSGLLESRKFSWTRFLSSIEKVVPPGVAMKRVDFDRHEGSLSLEGTAQSPEALRNLIVGLENSSSFTAPYLKHQLLEKGSISFNVVAVYREKADVVAGHGK